MKTHKILKEIAQSLSKIADHMISQGTKTQDDDLNDMIHTAYFWQETEGHHHLKSIKEVNSIPLHLLKAMQPQIDSLRKNTKNFMNGFGANNALLWGARGTGKSSLVKSIHADLVKESLGKLVLIEIAREDIASLPQLLNRLRPVKQRRFILFCDDLSFDEKDVAYKSLKAVLEGGIEGRPDNVIFYATSNRRHLMARDMRENEDSTIHKGEDVEESISLSDRFGLWIGFHNYNQDDYLDMVEGYIKAYELPIEGFDWRSEALTWSRIRGARSGRVAYQFIQHKAGELGIDINHKLD